MVNCNPQPQPGRVTLRQIAAVAGVSVMTVSRALRDGDHVSPAEVVRIRALAAKLGYRPDPGLASLVVYRHRLRAPAAQTMIGFLTTDPTRDGYRKNPVVMQALAGATERGRELGYRVEVVWLRDLGKRGLDPSAVLVARGYRGLVIARTPKANMKLGLAWEKFSCVALGYSLQSPAFHYVASHLFQDMSLAFTRTLERGYRRPMFVYSEDFDRRTLRQMHGSFLYEQLKLKAGDRIPPLCTEESHPVEDLRHGLKVHAPDVIFSPWPSLIDAIRKIGLRAPEDIGYVDFNAYGPDSATSGIFQGWHRIGRAAMDRLAMLMLNHTCGVPEIPEGTTVYGEWVEGRTLRRSVVADQNS
jgi:LacI family transcriptional regulator